MKKTIKTLNFKLNFELLTFNFEFLRSSSSGQTSLVVLLLLALGIGLSLALSSQVTTDIRISKTQEEAARAFAAAEAGLEKSLYQWQVGGVIPETIELDELGTTVAEITVEDVGGGQNFTFPTPTDAGDYQFIWLASHDDTGVLDETTTYSGNTLTVCWKDAALELVLFYKDETEEYKTTRWAFDPQNRSNNFSSPNPQSCSVLNNEGVSANLDLSSFHSPLFLVVKVFYNQTPLGVQAEPNTTLPIQGKRIISSGKVKRSDGSEVVRKLEVFQTWDLPPFVFLEPLFTKGGVGI